LDTAIVCDRNVGGCLKKVITQLMFAFFHSSRGRSLFAKKEC